MLVTTYDDDFSNVKKRSSTSSIGHQHLKVVINTLPESIASIDVAESHKNLVMVMTFLLRKIAIFVHVYTKILTKIIFQ